MTTKTDDRDTIEIPVTVEHGFGDLIVEIDNQVDETILMEYNKMMTGLYKMLSHQMSAEEVRMRVLRVVTAHICDRTTLTLKNQARKIEKYKQIKKIVNSKSETIENQ